MVLGLEVDYYRGRMDEVADLLAGYPFDVLLGSVHWVGAWRFDDLDDPSPWPSGRPGRSTPAGTPTPRPSRSWRPRGRATCWPTPT